MLEWVIAATAVGSLIFSFVSWQIANEALRLQCSASEADAAADAAQVDVRWTTSVDDPLAILNASRRPMVSPRISFEVLDQTSGEVDESKSASISIPDVGGCLVVEYDFSEWSGPKPTLSVVWNDAVGQQWYRVAGTRTEPGRVLGEAGSRGEAVMRPRGKSVSLWTGMTP